ncbi:putative inhibitor of apoptosis [Dreissena polymorpha]|uniref:putative inhibitor of apoptosis n=1 Tax=Dreissena polymorpha TaxID=45954 RepID=UPI0022654259|nr:putative inhibitor of apoptosis [Dreissena polymorpha]XP_052281865.1 putative inhibitor of apoptosis [Dreissena polymorpha]
MDRCEIQDITCFKCKTNDQKSVTSVGKFRLSIRIGQTTPYERSVKVSWGAYREVTIYEIIIKKGFLYTGLTNRKPSEIKWIIDGLNAFGKHCGLNTPPLLYISNRNMYVILAQHQFFKGLQWKPLHIGKGAFIPDVFLAHRNEYHQYFCCTVADFTSFAKRIGTGHIPFIKFDALTKSELTEGFSDCCTNECHYPFSANLNKPAYDSSELKFPIQASDDVENERIETVEQNGMHQSGLEVVGLENNLKWKTAKYPTYSDAEKRLATYRGWPLAEPSPNTLCSVGFFFTGHDYDLVRCFCCGIGLKDFSDSDNPLLEHAKHSSNCPFIIDYFESSAALEAYKQRFSAQDPEEIRRRQREQYELQQGRPVTTYRAKHERFRAFESRLATFTHWPQHLSQRRKELADAGMYYTGVDDHCRCFACDGGLRHWEPGDDPWIEHCRWFPACPYAREVKGDEFINLVQHSADQTLEENRRDEINGAMAAPTIDHSNIQRIVEKNRNLLIQDMGFPLDDVRSAVLELVQQALIDPDIDDIITRMEVMNERKQLDHLVKRSTGPPEPETLLKENQLLKGFLRCHSCHTNQVNCLFLPCTHHIYCLDCTQYSEKCPDCDKPIKERIRTYMA